MKSNFYAVIMAGGGGTRLWPVSRKSQPKQFLKLSADQSLFQVAIDRVVDFFSIENVIIVTVQDQIEGLSNEVTALSRDNFLIEPFPRGTAAVVGLAASILNKLDPDSVMAVLTADHIIENQELFINLLRRAYELAKEDYLVTLGILPSYPANGYGYIKAGESILDGSAFHVDDFKEKPDKETAEEYLKTGKYFWNSGMFIWRSECILREFKRQMPELSAQLDQISHHYGKRGFPDHLHDIWELIQPQTIDYGIMENAENVVVLPAENLGWSDVGSWDSLYQLLECDQDGNAKNHEIIQAICSKNNLVFSENKDKIIALIDMEDTIVVETENALLVCRRGQSQKVRQIIEKLKQNKLDKYL